MTERSRGLTTALKAALTVVILGVVLLKVPLRDLTARLSRLQAADVALLTVITVAQVSFAIVRWYRLLVRLGERPRFLALYGDALVGLTYNMFLPTTVGGDVMRALRARRRVLKSHHAWSSSLFERIAGLLAMALSGALAASIGLGLNGAIPPRIRVVAALIAGLFLFVFFFASAPFRILIRVLERRLPSAAHDVRAIAGDLEGPLATAGARMETLGWSVLVQALGIAFVLAGARGLEAPGHELAILIGVPLVHVLSMVPITLGGLGLREGLFVGVLGALSVPPDVALGLAAQWLASSLAFAFAGAAVALLDPSPAPAEVAP